MKKRNLNWLLALLAALALVFAFAGCADNGAGDADTGNGNTPGTDDDEVEEIEQECCSIAGCTQGSSCTVCDECETCKASNCCGDDACTVEICTNCTGGKECTGNAQCTVCTGCSCTDCDENAVDESYTVAGHTYTYNGTSIYNTSHDAPSSSDESPNTYLASVELEFASQDDTVDITVTYQTCTYNESNHSSSTSWDTAYDKEYEWIASGAAYSLSGTTLTVTLPADSDNGNADSTLTFSVDSNTDTLTLTGAADKDSGTLSTYTVKGGNDSDGCNLFDSGVEGALTANSDGGSEFELDD